MTTIAVPMIIYKEENSKFRENNRVNLLSSILARSERAAQFSQCEIKSIIPLSSQYSSYAYQVDGRRNLVTRL